MSGTAVFNRLALIGMGLIGSSIARAARAQGAAKSIVATARSAATRRRVAELGLADQIIESNAAAVEGADLVILCIPVGACGAVAADISSHLAPGAIVSDVGSVKVPFSGTCCLISPTACISYLLIRRRDRAFRT
jgi:cyclohexadieny/prephenate dehydrogenase